MPHPRARTSVRSTALGVHDEVEVFGTVGDFWSHTQVRDWVMLHPRMTRTAFHLYCLLRSMVSEKRSTSLRRMSLDQLCYLLPGVNGKPTSLTTVKDALQVLAALKLVTNPEGRLVASTGRGGIQTTLRRYQVHDLPPEAFDGWRNAWDKLDAYRPDWRQNPPVPPADRAAPEPVAGFVGRNSDQRSDQGEPRETAGRYVGRISDRDSRNSDHQGRNSGVSKPLTSEDSAPKEVFPRSSSLSVGPRPGPEPQSEPLPTGDEREDGCATSADEAVQAAAARIALAWAEGMRSGGGTLMPRRQAAIRDQAAELLAAGEGNVDFLVARAQWMGRVKPTWARFEDALTFEGQGAPPRRPTTSRPYRVARCGDCDDGWRYTDPDNALGPYRCPDCTELSSGASR